MASVEEGEGNEISNSSFSLDPVNLPPLPRDIKIRDDLIDYFEVVNYADKTLKCKLAGRHGCKPGRLFKFNSHRGWHNFERHLVNVHKFAKNEFIKTTGAVNSYRSQPVFKTASKSGRYCLACLGPSSLETKCLDEFPYEKLKIYFPGSADSPQLSLQLFYMFFLRNVVHFPLMRCKKFLRGDEGESMPDNWFFLCGPCKTLALEAVIVHRKLMALEEKLKGIKRSIQSQFKTSGGGSAYFGEMNDIENEIRNYVCDELGKTFETEHPNPNCATLPDQSDDVEMPLAELSDTFIPWPDDPLEDWSDQDEKWVPNVKVEIDETGFKGARPKRKTKHTLKPDMDYQDELEAKDDSNFLPRKTKAKKNSAKRVKSLEGKIKKKNGKGLKKDSGNIGETSAENQKHEAWDGTTKTYKCNLCPASFPLLKNYKRHSNTHKLSNNLKNQFDCNHCGYPFTSSRKLHVHKIEKHGEEEPLQKYVCTLCPFAASVQKDLIMHSKQHREDSAKERINGKFHCKLCDRLFPVYSLLCRHKRIMHHKEAGWKPIVCSYCTKVFSTQKHLQDHTQHIHENQSKFYCDACGRGFMYMSKLRRHMKTHSQDKAVHICDFCGADFTYPETLKKHIIKEHPESDRATSQAHIGHNVKSDSNSESHICKHCGLEKASQTLLYRHLRFDHKELYKHNCNVCAKSYVTPQSLRRHMSINHSNQEASCPYCDKKFLHQEYVRMHYKYCTLHPNKMERKLIVGDPVTEVSPDVSHNIVDHVLLPVTLSVISNNP